MLSAFLFLAEETKHSGTQRVSTTTDPRQGAGEDDAVLS